MKKILFALFAVIVASCDLIDKPEDDDNQGGQPEEQTFVVKEMRFYGSIIGDFDRCKYVFETDENNKVTSFVSYMAAGDDNYLEIYSLKDIVRSDEKYEFTFFSSDGSEEYSLPFSNGRLETLYPEPWECEYDANNQLTSLELTRASVRENYIWSDGCLKEASADFGDIKLKTVFTYTDIESKISNINPFPQYMSNVRISWNYEQLQLLFKDLGASPKYLPKSVTSISESADGTSERNYEFEYEFDESGRLSRAYQIKDGEKSLLYEYFYE